MPDQLKSCRSHLAERRKRAKLSTSAESSACCSQARRRGDRAGNCTAVKHSRACGCETAHLWLRVPSKREEPCNRLSSEEGTAPASHTVASTPSCRRRPAGAVHELEAKKRAAWAASWSPRGAGGKQRADAANSSRRWAANWRGPSDTSLVERAASTAYSVGRLRAASL